MKRDWLLPLLLISGLLMMGASGYGCGESSNGGGGKTEQAATTGKPQQAAKGKPAAKPTSEQPEMTAGQENALQSAQDYLDLSGFSKSGLIEQLSSSAGEGYSKADATFAVNHVDVNWNAEAVESAKQYLQLGPMSKSALIEQLSSPAGEQFTPAQAQYAANKAYGG